jgi:hypothetical protein
VTRAVTCALVLASGLGLLDGCGGESRAQAQYAAIVAGCKASLDITRDAGDAGATSDVEDGCKAALLAWEHDK